MSGRRLFAGIILTLLIAAMSISGAVVSAAEEPQFLLEMDSHDMDIDSNTLMTINMINAKGARVKEFVGMDWVYTIPQETARANKVVNGSMSYVETEIHKVYPYYAGQFKIWAIIEYAGKTYMTNKVELTVRDKSITDDGLSRKTFINTILTDNEVYLGQKAILSYELYSIYDIDSCFFLKDLHINDVLNTNIASNELSSEKILHDGIEYAKSDAGTSFLTPIKPGIYNIPSRVFYAYISDDEHLDENESTVRLLSEPKELIVKSLPTKNQPWDFSWIIGKLKVESKYSTTKAGGDNSVTLTVTASGDCSMDSLKKIFKEDPPGFTVYERETKYTESLVDGSYNAEKEFEITLIPQERGVLTIDPVYISYFDTESGSYKRAEIPGATVTVDGDDGNLQASTEKTGSDRTGTEQTGENQTGENQTGGNQAGAGQTGGNQEADPAVETIRIEQVSYETQYDGFWTLRINKVLVIIIAVLLIIGAAIFFLIKRPIRLERDDRLDDIYTRLLKAKDENEIYNHFNSMISHCFGLSLKASSRSEIAGGIQDKRFVGPILEVVEYVESEKKVPDKADIKLINMIREIYKMLKQRKAD